MSEMIFGSADFGRAQRGAFAKQCNEVEQLGENVARHQNRGPAVFKD